jgi:hypothetical protein
MACSVIFNIRGTGLHFVAGYLVTTAVRFDHVLLNNGRSWPVKVPGTCQA